MSKLVTPSNLVGRSWLSSQPLGPLPTTQGHPDPEGDPGGRVQRRRSPSGRAGRPVHRIRSPAGRIDPPDVIRCLLTPALRTENNLGTGTIVTFFVLNTAGVSALSFLLVAYFVTERARIFDLLDAEKERSERLLLNVLPESIADRLKTDTGVIADQFEDVTVLYSHRQ